MSQKAPAACPTMHGPNLFLNLHFICISVSPKYIDIFLTLPPPASLSLSLSLSHTHTHIHTARLFLLEMPGGLGSTIWSPPSAKDTFASSQCSCPPATTQCMESGSKPRAGAPCWAEQTQFFPRSWGGDTEARVQEWTNGVTACPDISSVLSPRFSCLVASHTFPLLLSGMPRAWEKYQVEITHNT